MKDNEAAESFERTVEDDPFDQPFSMSSISSVNPYGGLIVDWTNQPHAIGLGARESKLVSFRPLVGSLHQRKLIPLKVAPLTFEIELLGTPEEAVAVGGAALLAPMKLFF